MNPAASMLAALFNGAWQGALLCGLALLAFRVLRRLNATTMYAIWAALLAIALALPAANFILAPKPYTVRYIASADATAPVRLAAPRESSALVRPPKPAAIPVSERMTTVANAVFSRAQLIIWLLTAIAAVLLAMLIRDVVRMLSARRRVHCIEPPVRTPGECRRPYLFASSDEFQSPCVLGFAPALIVLPDDVLHAGQETLLSIVLHEREHVRRFDDVQNVLARFIGAIAFFCPGVRIALREMALYREQICDDAAIETTGNRLSYAMTLTGMAQWAQGTGAPVPNLLFKRKQLLHRLEVLLDSAVSHSLRTNRRFAASFAGVLALAALIVLRFQVPVVAQSIITPIPPRPLVSKPAVAVRKIRLKAMNVAVPIAPQDISLRILPIDKPSMPHKAVRAKVRMQGVQRRTRLNSKLFMLRARVEELQRVMVHTPAHLSTMVVEESRSAPIVATSTSENEMRALKQKTVILMQMAPPRRDESGELLDALTAAGMRGLSVDDLIALRQHGVSAALIRASAAYFGSHLDSKSLVYLADHGVSSTFLLTLQNSGVSGMAPASVVMLQDHGVGAPLIRSATSYFSARPSAADIAVLADHGVTALTLDDFRNAGVYGVGIGDLIRMVDHGVNASYVAKVRKLNPRATIDDIIRLHDAGV